MSVSQGESSKKALELERRIISTDDSMRKLSDRAGVLQQKMTGTGNSSPWGRKAQTDIKKTTGFIEKMIKRISQIALIRLVFGSINALISSATAGIKNISLVSTQANTALSSMAAGALQLKNSIGSALMPILQAIAPAISWVTAKLSELFTVIGIVSSRIFGGATTFLKAKAAAVDYGKTVQNVQSKLAGFDELTVIGEEGQSGMPTPGQMFEEVAIPEGTLSIADKIKAVMDKVTFTVKTGWDTVVSLISKYKEPIIAGIAGIIAAFATFKLVGAFTALGGVPGILSAIGQGFAALAAFLTTPAAAIAIVVGLVVAGFVSLYQKSEEFRQKVSDAIEGTAAVFKSVWETVFQPVLEKFMEVVGELWKNHLQPLLENIANLLVTIYNDFVLPLVNLFLDVFGPVIADIVNFLLEKFGEFLGFLLDVANAVTVGFQAILDFFTNIFSPSWGGVWGDIKESFTQAWDDMWKGFGEAWNGMWDTVQDIGGKILKFIQEVTQAFSEMLGMKMDLVDDNALGAVKNFDYGNASTDLAGIHIPKLASGAILKDNTLFLGGEYAGASTNPEIVSPQSLMYQTVVDANGPLVAAFEAIVGRVVDAIENQDYSTYLDGEKLYRSTVEHGRRQQRMTGMA